MLLNRRIRLKSWFDNNNYNTSNWYLQDPKFKKNLTSLSGLVIEKDTIIFYIYKLLYNIILHEIC